MARKTIEVNVDDLHKKSYTFYITLENNDHLDIHLINYKELSRENKRKKIWNVDRWYDWYNQRDRYMKTFMPIDSIVIPQKVKDAVVQWLFENITFITTENR